MKKSDISQADLSRKMGVSTSAVANWANGKSSPTVDTIERFASALGCQPWELLRDHSTHTDPELDALLDRVRRVDKGKRHHIDLTLQALERDAQNQALKTHNSSKPNRAK